MNILFVASDNDSASGAFLSMVRLCTILKNEYNHNVHIVLQRKGTGQELLDAAGISWHYIRTFNWISKLSEYDTVKNKLERVYKRIFNTMVSVRYKLLFKKLDIDIVHMNTSWTYLAAQVAGNMGIPYVWHIREFLEEDQKKCIWDKINGYRLIEQASCVIAISESIKRKYDRLIPNAHLVKIYNGIDSQKFYTQRDDLFCKDVIQMLIVGSINESKGQEQLIDACINLYKDGYKNFHLNIVGKGQQEYVNKLKEKVHAAKMDDFITFCGYRVDTQVFYQTSDITFVCSKAEAFGRVTVEAMMSGTLVIGAKSAATAELILDEKTGIFYENGNSDDLTKKIKWVLEHTDKAKMIAGNGQKYMLQNMTAENNAKKINEVYIAIKIK